MPPLGTRSSRNSPPTYLLRPSCWFSWLQLGGGDVDLVLDAAVGAGSLHGLSDRADEVLFDPEGLV